MLVAVILFAMVEILFAFNYRSGETSSHFRGATFPGWNSSDLENETHHEVTILQRQQLSAPQFCLISMNAILPSLKTDNLKIALNVMLVRSFLNCLFFLT